MSKDVRRGLRPWELCLLSSLAGCGGESVAPVAPTQAASPASLSADKTASADSSALGSPGSRAHQVLPAAHWVPRVAPSPLPFAQKSKTAEFYGPLRNNYGTRKTTYLGPHRVGLLDGGRRHVSEGHKLTPVSASGDGPIAVDSVQAIAPGLGGGFLFSGAAGLFFAGTFDGALRKLASDASAFRAVTPNAVLVGNDVLGTRDGKLMRAPPERLDAVFGHRSGFAVASSVNDTLWFTKDSRTWKKIGAGVARSATEHGSALIVFTDGSKEQLRVEATGKATSVTLGEDESLAMRMAGAFPLPDRFGLEDGFEGVLMDSGYALSGRHDDEWFGVRDGHVSVVRTATRTARLLDFKVGADGEQCSAFRAERPLIVCATLGTKLSVYQLDLEREKLNLERAIEVRGALAQRMGTVAGVFPTTPFITASCEGAPNMGVCARHEGGTWSTFPPLGRNTQLLAFPGEVVSFGQTAAGDWEFRSPALSRRFSDAELKPINDALGLSDLDKTGSPRVTTGGVLRTTAGIRMFYGPNPLEPTFGGKGGKEESVALDLPLDPRTPPSFVKVEGVVVVAGAFGLRLAAGKLYETIDGWKSWTEVPPPPTGVPADLAGAMCMEDGCLLDGWARIGWLKR